MTRNFQIQKKNYNLRKREWSPILGEKDLRKNFNLSNKLKKQNYKLMEKYSGPFEIKKKISPVIFDLIDSKGKIYKHVHVKDLKPFIPNTNAEIR